jgi:hypothetical protein
MAWSTTGNHLSLLSHSVIPVWASKRTHEASVFGYPLHLSRRIELVNTALPIGRATRRVVRYQEFWPESLRLLNVFRPGTPAETFCTEHNGGGLETRIQRSPNFCVSIAWEKPFRNAQ